MNEAYHGYGFFIGTEQYENTLLCQCFFKAPAVFAGIHGC
jgi:hypothetical protein